MAQLKDLIVNGSSRLIGPVYGKITNAYSADTVVGGTNGQFLKSDGNKGVWSSVSIPAAANNGKLSIKMNGSVNSTTFTANQSGNSTIDLGTIITAQTQLSKGTTSTGTTAAKAAVADISVSNHQITLTTTPKIYSASTSDSATTADNVDNFHLTSKGYPYVYSSTTTHATGGTGYYVKVKMAKYAKPNSIALYSSYDNKRNYAVVELSNWGQQWIFRDNNQNNGNIMAICAAGPSYNDEWAFFFQMSPSTGDSINITVYSDTELTASTLDTKPADTTFTTVSGTSRHVYIKGWVTSATTASSASSVAWLNVTGRPTIPDASPWVIGTNSGAQMGPAQAIGPISVAFGWNAIAEGNGSMAFGSPGEGNKIAMGFGSLAYGYNAKQNSVIKTVGNGSTAFGYIDDNSDNNTIQAMGNGAYAGGFAGEGGMISAAGDGAYAMGYSPNGVSPLGAEGAGAHAEGCGTMAMASGAHAEGNATVANAQGAHAEGNATAANAQGAHAEGCITTASGDYSHAGGCSSTANTEYGFAHGLGVIDYSSQTEQARVAFGKYNQTGTTTIFSIGNGTSNTARSNAFHVNSDGRAYTPNGFYETSDERKKDFHGDIKIDFNDIDNIPTRYFTWKKGEDMAMKIGTSAQEIQKVYPEVVDYDESQDLYTVDYGRLSIVAIAAVKELHKENETLKSEIELLKERLDKLENK